MSLQRLSKLTPNVSKHSHTVNPLNCPVLPVLQLQSHPPPGRRVTKAVQTLPSASLR